MAEWKPGDVVLATVGGTRENVRLVAGWSRYDPRLRWCEMSPRWGDGDDDECWFMPGQVTDHRRLVAIELPHGALAGWPVLIDALERAKEKTGLDMVFGGLIEQIQAQTELPKPYRVHTRSLAPWPVVPECFESWKEGHECPQCSWAHEHDWVAWDAPVPASEWPPNAVPIRCSKCGGRKRDQDLCAEQRHDGHGHQDGAL